MNQFEFQRDQHIANELRKVLYRRMDDHFSKFIHSEINSESVKLRFLIDGKENSKHEFIYPYDGLVNKSDVPRIIETIEKKIDKKLPAEVGFIYFSEIESDE